MFVRSVRALASPSPPPIQAHLTPLRESHRRWTRRTQASALRARAHDARADDEIVVRQDDFVVPEIGVADQVDRARGQLAGDRGLAVRSGDSLADVRDAFLDGLAHGARRERDVRG
jgi:hypothetical protein